jgi:predicted nucleotidyltransferase
MDQIRKSIIEVAKNNGSFQIEEYPTYFALTILGENMTEKDFSKISEFFVYELHYLLSENIGHIVKSEDNKYIEVHKKQINEIVSNTSLGASLEKRKVYVKDSKTGKLKKLNEEVQKVNLPEKKKNPRSWSNRYWASNNIYKTLEEVLNPQSIDVSSIKISDDLNPEIWESDEKMREDVRKVLLKNAGEFIRFAKLDNIKFSDIILTGSLANFNYNEFSDLDVHVLFDFNQISDNIEFVGEYLRTKKDLWNEKMPIKVKDHDVELYAQDTNEPHSSTGVYSLMNDEWITKPINKVVNIDTGDVQLKAADLMNMIDELETHKNPEKVLAQIDKIKEKLKKFRKAGLTREGEYSVENLAFKVLRNTGYLQKLGDIKQNILTKELSLQEQKA